MTGVWSPRKHLIRGLLVLLLGGGGFIAWSVLTTMHGAVVASGRVSVEARQQVIQHPDGGMVVALHVREGSRVEAGDALITLDGTDLNAQRAITQRALVEVIARQDGLNSEILGAPQVAFRDELQDFRDRLADFEIVLNAETALFAARRDTLEQSDEQLRERQVQSQAIIVGRERQLQATQVQLDIVASDLATQETLLERGLTESARVSTLRREAARLEGAVGELQSSIAEARSAIATLEIERLRQRAALREAAQSELRDLQPQEAELRERLILIDARVNRLVLRAPMAGSVLALQVNTIGGVVPAGAEIASIVPDGVPLILSVEVDPAQIDQVYLEQKVMARFPSFNIRTTPEVEGRIVARSPDAISEPGTGRSYFLVEVALEENSEGTMGDITLQPGMPVEVFIQTEARTPASFLLKPAADYWAYAMRER